MTVQSKSYSSVPGRRPGVEVTRASKVEAGGTNSYSSPRDAGRKPVPAHRIIMFSERRTVASTKSYLSTLCHVYLHDVPVYSDVSLVAPPRHTAMFYPTNKKSGVIIECQNSFVLIACPPLHIGLYASTFPRLPSSGQAQTACTEPTWLR